MKVSVATAMLLLTAMLAGCSSGGKEADAAKLDTASSAPILYLNVTVGNQTYRYTTATTAAASSTGTSASASVSVTGNASKSSSGSKSNSTAPKGNATKATGNVTPTGAAPLNVSVTLGAKGIPTGKAVSWTLDWGDGKAAAASPKGNATSASKSNSTGSASASASASKASANATAKVPGQDTGSKLPATVKHSYTEAGNRTVVFTLKLANATAATLKQPVKITAAKAVNGTGNATGNGTGSAGLALAPEVFHAEGNILLGGTEAGCDQLGAVDETWTIPAEKDGSAVSVKHLLVHLTGSATAVDLDLTVITPDGKSLGNTDGDAGDSDETVEADGPWPPGDFTVHISACAAINGDYTIDGTADLVSA